MVDQDRPVEWVLPKHTPCSISPTNRVNDVRVRAQLSSGPGG